jgi:hypothetical protein
VWADVVRRIEELQTVPELFTSSSGSSTSSSSSEGSDATMSESSVDGVCMCRKCKVKRKKNADKV